MQHLEKTGETFGKVDLELASAKTGDDLRGRLLCTDERRHVEGVLLGERRGNKSRAHQKYAQPARGKIQIKGFCQIDQGGLRRTIDGGLR
ncbi:hypothetical protein SDC9_187330 [bioreactor metagenome]|uniref:Uncharacterized protein n=1 Tax=bioreactor metagenome TaxID=1076179 RepID=A0A645HLC6_9ZZZZ